MWLENKTDINIFELHYFELAAGRGRWTKNRLKKREFEIVMVNDLRADPRKMVLKGHSQLVHMRTS